MTDTTATVPSELDVLIIGAGISGIGAAHHLSTDRAHRSFAVIEARADLGGTWDLFRYPGLRSDSDLYTYSFAHKPWLNDESIATADRIVSYLNEVIDEDGVRDRFFFGRRVRRAAWSSESARWTVEIEETTPDGPLSYEVSARWLYYGGGYYRYDDGFTPEFEGREDFAGQIIHPQVWPENFDHTGKRIVVIGSGATAVTLLPSLADSAEHVTMLQRTPSYVLPYPNRDPLAKLTKRLFSPERAHSLIRRRYIAQQRFIWKFAKAQPKLARRLIRRVNRMNLPAAFDVDQHFNPPYDPWDQRLCAVPDADLFKTLSTGKASIVTDGIERFTPSGIQLASGRHLDADVIVTATGFNLQLGGGIEFSVDGTVIDFSQSVLYRGLMLTGIPNLIFAFGYVNSSWTLKVDITGEYMNRLFAHMDGVGAEVAVAEAPEGMPTRPMLDFVSAGYVQRSLDKMPRRGEEQPWAVSNDFAVDREMLVNGPVADRFLKLSPAPVAASQREVVVQN